MRDGSSRRIGPYVHENAARKTLKEAVIDGRGWQGRDGKEGMAKKGWQGREDDEKAYLVERVANRQNLFAANLAKGRIATVRSVCRCVVC